MTTAGSITSRAASIWETKYLHESSRPPQSECDSAQADRTDNLLASSSETRQLRSAARIPGPGRRHPSSEGAGVILEPRPVLLVSCEVEVFELFCGPGCKIFPRLAIVRSLGFGWQSFQKLQPALASATALPLTTGGRQT